jgi:hypothetical protein
MRDALRRGLGRAYAMIEAGPADKYADLLLDACLFDPDPGIKSEGPHSGWLAELVVLAGLREKTLEVLVPRIRRAGADNWSNQRRFAIARHLGDEERPVRRAMLTGLSRVVDRQLVSAEPRDVESLVWEVAHLGGRAVAFAFIQAGRLVDVLPSRVSSYVYDSVRENLGADDVAEVIARDRGQPDLERYLQAVEVTREPQPERAFDPSWETIRDRIERQIIINDHRSRAKLMRGLDSPRSWGNRTNERELAKAAEALLSVDRRRTVELAAYLQIFEMRPFPGDPSLLLALARDRRLVVAGAALEALVHLHDPRIRVLAHELAFSRHAGLRTFVPHLLVRNWKPGDEVFVASQLVRAEGWRARDLFTLGVLDLAAAHAEADLVPLLLLAYERGPCAYCRHRVVEALVERNALPDGIREECRHDVFDETRELVEALPA